MSIAQVIYFAVLVLVVAVGMPKMAGLGWKESFKGAAVAIAGTSAIAGLVYLGFVLF